MFAFLLCFSYGISFFVSVEYTIATGIYSYRRKLYIKPSTSLPVQISLKDNEVDMSSLISALERYEESPYDQFSYLEHRFFPWFLQVIDRLCNSSNASSSCAEKTHAEVRGTLDRLYKDWEDQIHYPDGYDRPQSNLSKTAMDILNSDCSEDCGV